MRAELCKTCAHMEVCGRDKNIVGDVYVPPSPLFFDGEYRKNAWESFKKREAEGFPCDAYLPTIDPVKHVFSTAFNPETDMLVAERNGKKIEFVKVVRCQDCEMWGNSIILKDQSKGDCPNLGLMIDGDFFCKWGARKMDEVTE